MVDFSKRLGSKKVGPILDPVKLYDTLDRAHDKGPLRPAQEAVLQEWFDRRREQRNVIVKLHTGQGKTLVGLLILQSRLNEARGPALYLCPDTFLVDQTCEQAKQFGIRVCKAESVDDGSGRMRAAELPDDFLTGQSILVTSAQKLFNGMTKFGLEHQSVEVGHIVIDDAHACSDIVRESFRIVIDRKKNSEVYDRLLALFASDIERQGGGSFAEIQDKSASAILPVPYWIWISKISEVRATLADARDKDGVKFAWPLVKDVLEHCQCNISGRQFEIEPHAPPIHAFKSFTDAAQRVFMSATVTDDSFLVKGLRIDEKAIIEPVAYAKERWSGEKMVLVPSLIDARLSREAIVSHYGPPDGSRRYGVVVLSPSESRTKDWDKYDALVAMKDDIRAAVAALLSGEHERTVVLVNRYDGVDLPDDSCRLLILDGRPHSENLADRYEESCRPDSDVTLMRLARRIEQGMGRSVRGEKDFSVIALIGDDLIRALSNERTRKHLSPQLRTQLDIGREIVLMARQEGAEAADPVEVIRALVRQCVGRNPDWKQFYSEQMQRVSPSPANLRALQRFSAELRAEDSYARGEPVQAADEIQRLLDSGTADSSDKGWYLQMVARFLYETQRDKSEQLQVAAHKINHKLLKPQAGVAVSKIVPLDHGRMEEIIKWVSQHETYQSLNVTVTDVLDRLTFGTAYDRFEGALQELGEMLGFRSDRPDTEYREGPDNLWALVGKQYILWECKSEVDTARSEVNKREAEQMNRSCAWFDKHYAGMSCAKVLIHPAFKLEHAAALTHKPVHACRERELKGLVTRTRAFFSEFQSRNLQDLSVSDVQKLVDRYRLAPTAIVDSSWKELR